MNMTKSIQILAAAVTALFLSASVLAQEGTVQIDVSAEDLLSGKADEVLQQAGAQASIEGRPVSVTAPSYWREMVEEQLNQGAGDDALTINYRETFIESVIVRLGALGQSESAQAQAEAAAEEEVIQAAPPPVVDIQPERPQVAFERPTATLEPEAASAVDDVQQTTEQAVNGANSALRPSLELALSETAIAQPPASNGSESVAEEAVEAIEEEVVDEPPVAVEEVAVEEPAVEEPAVVEQDTEVVASQPADTVSDEIEDDTGFTTDQARDSLERRLNSGRTINNSLRPDQLRPGDQLFRTGGVIAVVRRSQLRNSAYWLDGEVDLERDEIRFLQPGKYEVRRLLDDEEDTEVAVVTEEAPEELVETAQFTDNLEERTRMEQLYNGGNPIEQSVSTNRLLKDDMLYVGDSLIVVVRRTRVRLERYWLEGEIDLSMEELSKQGNRKYRVSRDVR
ncbi:MAG: hypothetical protein DHS20C11_04660 [Lysobacteraceae bacterium]|nr:MAG: hypothetical protein DHS20C11_04660 [Xanthomonadaceae bacterium]